MPQRVTINAANYLNIVKDKVAEWLQTSQCLIFMHDGAPCHQTKVVKAWSGSSPDLNPIENCLVKLKEEVSLNETQRRSVHSKLR